MKYFALYSILFLYLCKCVLAQNKGDCIISCEHPDVKLVSVFDNLEESCGVHFYYDESILDSLSVSVQVDSLPLIDLLEKTSTIHSLSYTFDSFGNIFIYKGEPIVTDLPAYAELLNSARHKDAGKKQTEIEKKYLLGREPNMIETITVGQKSSVYRAKPVVITGRLVDINTKEPLVGATLFIKELKQGAVTDQYGVLTIALHCGKYSAKFQCVGMGEVSCILDVCSEGDFTLFMTPKLTPIDEVTVRAENTYSHGSQSGYEKISLSAVKDLPAMMGEKDVLNIAKMLPGVVSVSEGTGGVNVRGGNADQNLFYFNEVPVFNTSHLFGFFSAMNSNIVSDFSIFKGYVPAEYGGRISSIFQIGTKKGNKTKFYSYGGISPVSAHIATEFPIVKEKVSATLSYRTTYSNWVLKQLHDPQLRDSRAGFYDVVAEVDYDINTANRLNIFLYNSNDKFSLADLAKYTYSNFGSSMKFQHRFSPGFKSETALIVSQYKYQVNDYSIVSAAYKHNYLIKHNELKQHFEWILNDKLECNWGISSILYKLDRGSILPIGRESKREKLDLGDRQGLESAVYLENKYSPVYWLKFNAGFRYSMFNELGPVDVYGYVPGLPLGPAAVNDTTKYSRGEIAGTSSGPEFRFAADMKFLHRHSIKLSFSQMKQYLFMLSNTITITPSDQWSLMNKHIKPMTSNQYSLGYYLKFPRKLMNLSVEAYWKDGRNIVEYKEGAEFLTSEHIETDVLQGTQKAYGVEFMIEKQGGSLHGWLSYAYSRSLLRVNGASDVEKVNKGKWYPANYDKPNVFNLVANYRINRRFSISTNMSYTTGRPVTIPQDIFYINYHPFVNYSERNAYRLPDYLRTDLSFAIEGNLKKRKFIHSSYLISIYNVTARHNPHTIFFKSEEKIIKGYKYSIIGTTLFTVTWNFKLGNYANN